MNTAEARTLLKDHLERYRRLPYQHLAGLVDSLETDTVQGSSGVVYQVECKVYWDGEPNADVRVIGLIDDGGIRTFVPLNEGFIMAPSGQFVDE